MKMVTATLMDGIDFIFYLPIILMALGLVCIIGYEIDDYYSDKAKMSCDTFDGFDVEWECCNSCQNGNMNYFEYHLTPSLLSRTESCSCLDKSQKIVKIW